MAQTGIYSTSMTFISIEKALYVAFADGCTGDCATNLTQAPPIHEMDEAQFTILQAVLAYTLKMAKCNPCIDAFQPLLYLSCRVSVIPSNV